MFGRGVGRWLPKKRRDDKLLHSCRYCGKIHDKHFDCGKKPQKRYRRSKEEVGRYTSAWTCKSDAIKARSYYLCAVCLDCGIINGAMLETHHIVKLRERPDLLLEDSNLICLCKQHHREADRGNIDVAYLKELAEARERGTPRGIMRPEMDCGKTNQHPLIAKYSQNESRKETR